MKVQVVLKNPGKGFNTEKGGIWEAGETLN